MKIKKKDNPILLIALGHTAEQDPTMVGPVAQLDSVAFEKKLGSGFPAGSNSVGSGCPARPSSFWMKTWV